MCVRNIELAETAKLTYTILQTLTKSFSSSSRFRPAGIGELNRAIYIVTACDERLKKTSNILTHSIADDFADAKASLITSNNNNKSISTKKVLT